MCNAVLFRSEARFQAFKEKLAQYGVNYTILDFKDHEWISFDYSNIDFIVYFSSFQYTSNHPLALMEVHDNLEYIHAQYPNVKMFPDPNVLRFYNDKYKQFLFLKGNHFPIPETIPLLSMKMVDLADQGLGYPMVIKNRYGAGGGSVYRIFDKNELIKYYNLSTMNFFNLPAAKHFVEMFRNREFLWHLIKDKRAAYPFFSPPLLAQKYVKLDRDLKTVIGNFEVVEAHWRFQAHEQMWKVNIDDGGIGVWGEVPEEALDISVRLAKALKTSWLNIDMIIENGRFVITEFSPVWHHYAYNEKPTFIYKDDYNINLPLDHSLDLERIIVESFINPSFPEVTVR